MGKYETPAYEIVKTDGDIEIRHYEDFLIVTYTTNEDPYSDKGFQTLFQYIQADNSMNATVSMTVPVLQEFKSDGMTMSFIVPEKYVLGVPKPNHPDLHIDQFKEGYYAAITFKGSQSMGNLRKHQTELLFWLKKNNLEMTSDIIGAYYNAPFTPPFMRRNELLVKINWRT